MRTGNTAAIGISILALAVTVASWATSRNAGIPLARDGVAQSSGPVGASAPSPKIPRGGQSRSASASTRDGVLAVFVAELRDDAWAPDAESKFRASIKAVALGDSTINSVECRSTMCRADVVGNSVADAEHLSRALADPSARPWNADVLIVPGGDTLEAGPPISLTIFIGREGSSIRTE